MNKKVILFFAADTELGGAERSLLDLVKVCRESSEYLAKVVVPRPDGALLSALENLEVETINCPFPTAFNNSSRKNPLKSLLLLLLSPFEILSYISSLKGVIQSTHPDILHSNGLKMHLVLGTLNCKVPLIWHLRDFHPRGIVGKLLKIMQIYSRPHLVANSQATLETYSQSALIKNFILYNGIDVTGVQAEGVTDNFRHWKKQFPKTLGLVATFTSWKGHKEFIRVAKNLSEKFDLGFVLVGGKIYSTAAERKNSYEEEIKELIHQYGLEKKFFMTGFVSNPLDYIRELSLQVHCSNKPEPFGRVIVEGFSQGIPLIASGEGGVLEIIEENKNGLLFEPRNLASLQRQIEWALDNPDSMGKMAKEGKKDYEKKFSISQLKKALPKVYQALLQR